MVTIDSPDLASSGVEFALTDVSAMPGVFRLAARYPTGQTLDLDTENESVYRLAFDGCAAPCERREVARIQFGGFGGVLGNNFVLEVFGPSGPGADPVLIDCDGTERSMPSGGTDGGFVCFDRDIIVPPGAMVLNAVGTCVPEDIGNYHEWAWPVECDAAVGASNASMAVLKHRYR